MYTMMVVLTVVYVLACLFLCFVVLIQKGEGGGLGGAFGGGAVDVAFGAKADMTWKRATAVCAAIFMLLAMFLGVLHDKLDRRSLAEDAQRRAQEQQAPATPDAPAAPGAPEAPDGAAPVSTQ